MTSRARGIGKLLCHRWRGCWRADWLAVCRLHPHCRAAAGQRGAGRRCFHGADDRSFQRGPAPVGSSRAPWQTITTRRGSLGSSSARADRSSSGIVARRMRTQTTYRQELEDWLSRVLLLSPRSQCSRYERFRPFSRPRGFVYVGAAALLLLFIGIHNTWDAVAYYVFVQMPNAKG